MISCQGCSLAKIQQYSLSSINMVPHQHFAYDTVLRNLHCERPKVVRLKGKGKKEDVLGFAVIRVTES
jgi:hypothetical protein